MAQHRQRERLDVGDRDVIAAVNERARLARENERLRRAQAGAPLDPLVHERVAALAARTRRVDQPHRVARDLLGDDHLPHQLLNLQDLGAGQHPLRRLGRHAGRLRDDAHLFVLGQVLHHDVEHEAIELRLGQRIGAFELDRVLRREDEERPLERIASGRRR